MPSVSDGATTTGEINWLLRPTPERKLLTYILRLKIKKVLDAAEGLHYLHSRDPPICHGDVKGVSRVDNRQSPGYSLKLAL